MTRISVTVDGAKYTDDVEPRTLLVHYLRERLGKTGTVVGCDTSNCGACTVHLDGRSVKSCNVLAVQADGQEVTTDRGPRPGRRAAPDAGGLPRVPRPPVRLLHPGHDHAVDRPAQRQPEADRGGDPRAVSRATCAGAPATTTSSAPCRPPRARSPGRRSRGERVMTVTEDRPPPRSRDRPRPAPQGGPAADHRPHPLDRQHPAHRDAAHRDGAQPVRPREDHQHRHRGGEGSRPTWSRCSPAPTSGRPRA